MSDPTTKRTSAEIEQKLRDELSHVRQGYAKLDQGSYSKDDIWAGQIYQRLIMRQTEIINTLYG